MSLVAVMLSAIQVSVSMGCVARVLAKVNVLHAVRQRQVSRMVCVATSRSGVIQTANVVMMVQPAAV